MGNSKSSDSSSTETNTVQVDRSTAVDEGNAILDSIIVDPSDKVMIKTIEEHRATFDVLTKNSSVQLGQLLGLGSEILGLAEQQQIQMSAFAFDQLRSGLEFLKRANEQGKYVVDFADRAMDQSYNLSEQALQIVADTKTENYTDMMRMLSTTIAAVAMFAIMFGRK